MDGVDRLAPLRVRVEQLRADRDRASAELEQARAALAAHERDRAELAAAAARKRNTFRALGASTVGLLVLLIAGGSFYLATHVADETARGTVRAVEGWAPASVGDRCDVRVISEFGPYNARLVVDCGGGRLYGHGSFGAVHCTVEGGRAVSCRDPKPVAEDGDPTLSLDLRTRSLVLADHRRWRVDVVLDR